MATAGTRWTVIAAIVVLMAAQAMAVNLLGRYNVLPEGSEHWTENWLIKYFSKRPADQSDKIAIVEVDFESLGKEGLPQIPQVDRGWMAKLIAAVDSARPKAIGLDFYYSTAIDPAKDEQLASAIRDAKAPVVVGAVDGSFFGEEKQRQFEREFLARTGRAAGHIYFKRSVELLTLGDSSSRLIDHGPSADGYRSLTSQLAQTPPAVAAFGAPQIPGGVQRIDWLLRPQGTTAFVEQHAWKITQGDAAAISSLKDKIVLIGPEFPKIDRHMTPLSVSVDGQRDYPGLFVHAQALAQILDGRWLHVWSDAEQFALLFVFGLAGAYFGFGENSTRRELVQAIGGTLVIVLLSIPLFMLRFPLPTALAIVCWGGGLWISGRVSAWTAAG